MTNNSYFNETNNIYKFDTGIEILNSSNRFNNHKTGKIVNISKNMLILKESKTGKIVKIAKKEISFFRLDDQHQKKVLPGKRLLGRPEEVIV